MKHVVRISLVLSIIVLGYLTVMSILTPIHFEEERMLREKAIISNLIHIRKAQIEFKNQYGHYTASTDTLIDFILNGKMPVVLKEGTLTDEQLLAGLTEKKALQIVKSGNKKEIAANGLENFRRDTSYVSVYESLFVDVLTVDKVKELDIIPFSNGQKFEMETRMHTNANSGIVIPLFEARAPYDAYLSDLDRQELVNLKDQQTKLEKYTGLKVGSVEEPNNNAGNWE
ncbi:MAG TPA: hypothetical protein P5564_01870 [Paludibacteraceae bacterium]|nr:hypothetical protein [Paludibacteraceae bacterium]HRS67343.1 hypothetical protein [Paludibacteraceae bacterium]